MDPKYNVTLSSTLYTTGILGSQHFSSDINLQNDYFTVKCFRTFAPIYGFRISEKTIEMGRGAPGKMRMTKKFRCSVRPRLDMARNPRPESVGGKINFLRFNLFFMLILLILFYEHRNSGSPLIFIHRERNTEILYIC